MATLSRILGSGGTGEPQLIDHKEPDTTKAIQHI